VGSRPSAQLKALSSLMLNLAVAVFSLGVLAPILEIGLSPAAEPAGIWPTVGAGAVGFLFVALGLYLTAKAESPERASS